MYKLYIILNGLCSVTAPPDKKKESFKSIARFICNEIIIINKTGIISLEAFRHYNLI